MFDDARRVTRQVQTGHVLIGGGAPITVQSMCTTDTRDVKATVAQIRELERAGCEIVRVAVPDEKAAQALREICLASPIPVIADIHFDHRLAISAIRSGVHKIRINPGNMSDREGLRETARLARSRCIPIRVGINAGSLDRAFIREYGGVTAEALAAAALLACKQLEDFGFYDIVLSAKASSPILMIRTYRLLADACPYPLHLGVTEAGTKDEGVIRSSVGLGALLAEGIGDTIRVSLTADPVEEVRAAYSILNALSIRQKGVTLISCPTCGRTEVPLIKIAEEVADRLTGIDAPLRVAVMGCVVNGPGEAREADVGIAGGKDAFVLFRKGEVIRKVSVECAVDELMEEIKQIIAAQKAEHQSQ